MSTADTAIVPAYVCFAKCGCCVAAVVDDGNAPDMVSEALADWAKSGGVIERKTVGWVRENLKFCQCLKPAAAPKPLPADDLFASAS